MSPVLDYHGRFITPPSDQVRREIADALTPFDRCCIVCRAFRHHDAKDPGCRLYRGSSDG